MADSAKMRNRPTVPPVPSTNISFESISRKLTVRSLDEKSDILVSLWGDAYVNVDFYEVVRTTAKYVFLVALLSHREKIHYMQYTAMPVWVSGYGVPFERKSIQLGSSEPFCRISSSKRARVWKGGPEFGSYPLF